MNYLLKSIILATAVSFSFLASGQINFKKGYIINHNNDTLHGLINDRGGYKNAKACVFKVKNEPVINYHPEDIKAYRMLDDKYYVSRQVDVKGENKYVFIDVLLKGEVSLYHHRKNKTMAYFIEKRNSNMIGLVNEEVLLRYKHDDNVAVLYSPTYVFQNKIYKDTLRTVFSDSEKIQDRIGEVEYDPKSLIQITKAYLKEKCSGNDCIDYERDLNKYSPRFGILSGIQLNSISFLPSEKGMYSNEETSTIMAKNFTSYPVGIFVNIPLNLINDRLSFQIETIWNERLYKEELGTTQNFARNIEINTQTIGIPLLFKYQIGRGLILPTIAAGKETAFVFQSKVVIEEAVIDQNKPKDLMIHAVTKGGWFGEIGLNFKLGCNLTLFSNVRIQSGKNLIIEEGNQRAGYNTVVKSSDFVKEYKTNYSTLLVGIKF
jgi:hypothetical protein